MIRNEKIIEALEVINKRISLKPKVAIVLGSGLGMIAEAIENPTIVPYKDIPYWPRSTAPGHAGCLVAGTLEGVPVIAMQGRVHYYEGYTMDEVTFPVRIFGELGVRVYYATNAAGGVNLGYKAGELVNIYDHINFTGTNPLIGENESAWTEIEPPLSPRSVTLSGLPPKDLISSWIHFSASTWKDFIICLRQWTGSKH